MSEALDKTARYICELAEEYWRDFQDDFRHPGEALNQALAEVAADSEYSREELREAVEKTDHPIAQNWDWAERGLDRLDELGG